MTSLTARLKQATGLSDQQIANLTGRPRSTIQAVIAGKLADTVTPEQILPTIDARLAMLAGLAHDLHKMNVDILAALLNSGDTNHGDNTQ